MVAALGAFLFFFLPPFALPVSLETGLVFKMSPTIFQGEKERKGKGEGNKFFRTSAFSFIFQY